MSFVWRDTVPDIRSIMMTSLAAISLAAPAVAQDSSVPKTGKNEAMLRQSLEASARGECPAGMMSPQLHDACMQQMPALGDNMKGLGAIKSIAYLGVKSPGPGVPPVEDYRVTFANGSSDWLINTGADGKINFL